MNKYQNILEIYAGLTAFEKSQLQIKRRSYEKEMGIKFLNLQSYVNQLAIDASIHILTEKSSSRHLQSCS